jgi:hypothetical protein
MSLLSDERETIQELAEKMAKRDGRPSGGHYQKILSAIWLGELPIVHCYNGDRDQLFTPFTRDELRMAVAAFGELNIGRAFMGVTVTATSKTVPHALPFDVLAKFPAQKYDKRFRDVYLDRLLIETAAVEALFKANAPPREPKVSALTKQKGRPKGVGRNLCDDEILAEIKRELASSPDGTSFDSVALKYVDRVKTGTKNPYSILRRWRRKAG